MTTGDVFAFAAAFEVLRETRGSGLGKKSLTLSVLENEILEIGEKPAKPSEKVRERAEKAAGGPRKNRSRDDRV